MKQSWLKGLDEKDQEAIRNQFNSSKRLLSRLEDIIQSKIDLCEKATTNTDNYESPSWALRQADYIGYKRALKEIKNLFF